MFTSEWTKSTESPVGNVQSNGNNLPKIPCNGENQSTLAFTTNGNDSLIGRREWVSEPHAETKEEEKKTGKTRCCLFISLARFRQNLLMTIVSSFIRIK